MSTVRVRFAPSPTGPLHIGGVRTALYNYLFAKKHHGKIILRIEDTDQNRYVAGAEDYIIRSLEWLGMKFDESPALDGPYAPYRQSERKSMYRTFGKKLVEEGKAYYAFDTPEELQSMREAFTAKGVHSPKYDAQTRMTMKNSLTLSEEEVAQRVEANDNVIIRLYVEPGQTIHFEDEIRGHVQFNSSELDDKVLIKADGMPTYHMANIIDDHSMKISHVIRGEEWLSSTAHHVLLYRAFGWEATMPKFAHLPLILKPVGNGKLSKRDGAKFGFPVFPLNWDAEHPEDRFKGFDGFGFDPNAVINFLALLGWNPGTDQEMFSMEELIEQFSIEHIVKSGARFDYEKAKWFNQQYILKSSSADLVPVVQAVLKEHGVDRTDAFVEAFIDLMKPRVHTYDEFYSNATYMFGDIVSFDEKTIKKKWKGDNIGHVKQLFENITQLDQWDLEALQTCIKGYIEEKALSFGNILPLVRIATSGTTKGPDVFEMMIILGASCVKERLQKGLIIFDSVTQA